MPPLVAAVSSEIAVTAEDMAELNAATKTADAAVPELLLVLFASPLPGVAPGLGVGVYMHAMIARCILVRICMWFRMVDGRTLA